MQELDTTQYTLGDMLGLAATHCCTTFFTNIDVASMDLDAYILLKSG